MVLRLCEAESKHYGNIRVCKGAGKHFRKLACFEY